MRLEVKNLMEKNNSLGVYASALAPIGGFQPLDFSVLQLQACLVLLCSLRPVLAYSCLFTINSSSLFLTSIPSSLFLVSTAIPSIPPTLCHHFPLFLCPKLSLQCSWLLSPYPDPLRSCCPSLHPDSLCHFHPPQPPMCPAQSRVSERRQIKARPFKQHFLAPYVK